MGAIGIEHLRRSANLDAFFRRRERFGITCAGALPGQTWKPTWFGNDALLGKSPEVKEAASWDGSLSESQMI